MVSSKVFLGDSRDLSVLEDSSVDLIVTSPPYWHIKDYGCQKQIGHGQDLHSYLKDLFLVWRECARVLGPGRRICINIGDQFARSSVYGRYKVIPLHAEIISQLEVLGLDFMGSIIWQKRTTLNTSGGAVVMGSYPHPPNGIVEIDYEHILIFKRPGRSKKIDRDVKEASALTKEEWKQLYSGHWNFGGARQISHEAMFPEELPSRLIRMFSFKGETVFDPFLGSGTTILSAVKNGRNGIGFELNGDFLPVIEEKFKGLEVPELIRLPERRSVSRSTEYKPRLLNAEPLKEEDERSNLTKVTDVSEDLRLRLSDGRKVSLGGLRVLDGDMAHEYLIDSLKGKEIYLEEIEGLKGYLVFLKNRIYINGELVKMGAAEVLDEEFSGKKRLLNIQRRSRIIL